MVGFIKLKMKRICLDAFVIFALLGGLTLAAQASSGEVRDFSITGYYSPLLGQSFYVTGSYEGDIRLNGKGIAGADGTPVFPGMMAAPGDYTYGTKICLPDFGCGSVHDRGGAIVSAGGRDIARHDRLDLWLGYGEEGLLRALQWGLVHTTGTIHAKNSSVQVKANFSAVTPLARVLNLPNRQEFSRDLGVEDSGPEVRVLQSSLKTLGYYKGGVSGTFTEALADSLRRFQLDHFVILKADDNGNGRFGPKTRETLSRVLQKDETEKIIEKKWNEFHFEGNVSRGSHSDEVWKLQEILIQAEYLDHAPTGYFGPLTKEALIAFQVGEGVIKTATSAGAGNVGPNTTAKLNEVLEAKLAKVSEQDQKLYAFKEKQNRLRQIAGKPFEQTVAQK